MKPSKKLFFLIMVTLLLFFPFNHYSSSSIEKFSNTNQEPTYWPTNGWRTSIPEEQGVSSVKLQEMYEYFNSTIELKYVLASMYSILVIRNGFLIHETYMSSFPNENTSNNIYSCTKSVTSSLLGIAIEEGFIGGVNDLVLDYFPNRTILNRDARKEAMTIEDLLTMRSGLSWDEENYNNPDNDYSQMYGSPNAVQYVLDRPMSSSPGGTWLYNTGCSHLLSAIIDNTTGIGTKNFAQSRLFTPLGIDSPEMSVDFQNIPYGGSNLRITPRQMAKFGFLYLNNGSWDGEQIISEEWIVNSTRSASSLNTATSYGYQWWIEPSRNSFSARGYGGQFIVVIPDSNMVVVFTANSNILHNTYWTLIDDYIIPAIGYEPPSTTTTTEKEVPAFYFLPIIIAMSFLVKRRKRA
ncbi:MAG: serine hydrolase domain-containing protein [Candidatus Hodarchaeales archaeon]|jgi:CubicO group peptidase (beta-lactamase class C family)